MSVHCPIIFYCPGALIFAQIAVYCPSTSSWQNISYCPKYLFIPKIRFIAPKPCSFTNYPLLPQSPDNFLKLSEYLSIAKYRLLLRISCNNCWLHKYLFIANYFFLSNCKLPTLIALYCLEAMLIYPYTS